MFGTDESPPTETDAETRAYVHWLVTQGYEQVSRRYQLVRKGDHTIQLMDKQFLAFRKEAGLGLKDKMPWLFE